MKIKKGSRLPPWIDVVNKDPYVWMSPCMPLHPVFIAGGASRFDGVALRVSVGGEGSRKVVCAHLERRPFVERNGIAVPVYANGDGEVAYGKIPFAKFTDGVNVPEGRVALSRIFTFYDDCNLDVVTISAAGSVPSWEAPIVANVCRGYDMPKGFVVGQNYATMTFLFKEGGKSLDRWLEGLKCRKSRK